MFTAADTLRVVIGIAELVGFLATLLMLPKNDPYRTKR
jgi:hypothetical protein